MKRSKTIFFITLFFMGVMAGCSSDDFNGYQADSFIHFNKSMKDSTTFSFAYDEALKEGDVDIKLNIISGLQGRDRQFAVRFLPNESTAQEGRDFTVNTEQLVVKANDSIGVLKVHVMKDESLKGKSVHAVFEIVENEEFKPGVMQNRKAKLVITDKLTQPEWWDTWHIKDGLGVYSEKKFRLFIQVTGQKDLTLKEDGGEMEYYDMRVYVTQFKYWLIEHPQVEENGEQMNVPIIG